MTRRAGLYLRISQDRDGTQLAVDRQREDGDKLISGRGWNHVDTYVDNDVSARGRKRRPEFDRLLKDVVDGRIDTIVAERWDRLGRNRRDDLRLIETCQPRATVLAFMRDSDVDLTTAAGRLAADIRAGVARHEIETKSERQVRQAQQAAEKGKPGAVGQRAFGYTPDGMHLDAAEAPVVRQLYDRWLSGEGLSSLARSLNERGLHTPRGNRWTRQNVREVLANPRNAGLRGIRRVVNAETGTRSQWHEIIGPAIWPGIIPEERWRSALERIQDPTRDGQHDGRNGQRYLLSGIAVCGICGDRLITGGRATERLLRCPSRAHVSRRADFIEDYAVEALMQRFRRGGIPLPDQTEPDELDAIRSEAIYWRNELDALVVRHMDKRINDRQLEVGNRHAEAKLAELDKRIAAAGAVDVSAPLRTANDPDVVWEQLPVSTRREVVRRLMTVRVLSGRSGRPGGVRFDPATVEIVWH